MKVETKDFGKDHWSLFAYIETRCVDHKGVLDLAHLRTKNPALNSPSFPAMGPQSWNPDYGTRLSGYFKDDGTKDESRKLNDHDDLDCFDDLEEVGYIENAGSGLNPACVMTKVGSKVAAKLREHKASGKHFATFKLEN